MTANESAPGGRIGLSGAASGVTHDPRVMIRLMRAADLDAVARIEVEVFGDGAWTPSMLASELGGPGRWYVVLEYEEIGRIGPRPVIGYAGLWFDGEQSQVMTIAVATDFQRRGLGAVLLQALVDRSITLGAQAVLLEVRVDNSAAIALYESFGFEQIAVRKRYYQPEDKDAAVMRLLLGAESPYQPA